MDQFFERHKLPKVMQGETGILTRPIVILKIESIIINLPGNKALGLDGFTGTLHKNLRKK